MHKFENLEIYLRPVTIEDAQLLLASVQIEEIRYMTGTTADFTLEQIQQHILKCQKDTSRYDFAICLNSNHQMIGELVIMDIDQVHKTAGFRISMCHIGLTDQGYGTQAISLVLEFVFNTLNLEQLELEVYSHNQRGLHVYQKLGFKIVDIIKNALNYKGKHSDEIKMLMLRSDYDQKC